MQLSANKKWAIYRIAYTEKNQQGGEGATYIVDYQTQNILYAFNRCLSEDLHIDEQGNYIAEVLNPIESKQWTKPCLKIYYKGSLKETFGLEDLNLDQKAIQSQPHLIGWAGHQLYFPIYTLADSTDKKAYNLLQYHTPFIQQDTLFLVSADRWIYGIYLPTCRIVDKQKAILFLKNYTKPIPAKYTPTAWQFPPPTIWIDTQTDYTEIELSLLQAIQKKPLKKVQKTFYYVYLWIEIDNLGNAQVVWKDIKKVKGQTLFYPSKIAIRVEQWLQKELPYWAKKRKNKWLRLYLLCR